MGDGGGERDGDASDDAAAEWRPSDLPDVPRRAGETLREWVHRLKDELGLALSDVLILSTGQDPMNIGTDADHAKGEWFADRWRAALGDRERREIHTRGVHYAVVMSDAAVAPPTATSWDSYRNTERCYTYLKDASVAARVLGYVPLSGILDERNETTTLTRFDEPHRLPRPPAPERVADGVTLPPLPAVDAASEVAFDPDDETALVDFLADEIAAEMRRSLRLNADRQSPYHVEVWSEKTLPAEVVAEIRAAGGDVVVEGSGDLSLTVANEFVTRLGAAGKPAVVCYLSDYDPKGTEMAPAMAGKLEWFRELGELPHPVVVQQVAMTPALVEAHDFPRTPIAAGGDDAPGADPAAGSGLKAYRSRVTGWERDHGTGAVELNVLESRLDLFREVVREALAPLSDPELPTRNERALAAWERSVREAVADAVADADGLRAARSALADWLDDFDADLEAVRAAVTPLHERVADESGPYRRWREAVADVVRAADVPRPDPPAGVAAGTPPPEPVYDSERSYLVNVQAARDHR